MNNKFNSSIQIKIIWIFVIILSITYGISFFNSHTKDNRKPVKTSLLNPKNIKNIDSIVLSEDLSLMLKFNNQLDLWEVQELDENNPWENQINNRKLPADQIRVQSLIQDLSQIINIYELSDFNSQNDTYGLINHPFTIAYTLNDGKSTSIVLGNHDFSEKFRYMTTDFKKVYEFSSNFDNYCSTAIQTWSDPLIISKEILHKKDWNDVQKITISSLENGNKTKVMTSSVNDSDDEFKNYVSKLFDLRHSGFSNSAKKELNCIVKIEFGDTTDLSLNIYTTEEENEYCLLLRYDDKIIKKIYDYEMKISSWTYNKINTIKL